LRDRPDPFEDLEPVARAFGQLSAGRQVQAGPAGAVPGPIPLTEIRAWCDLFPVDDIEAFLRLIRAMDDVYLRHLHDRGRSADP